MKILLNTIYNLSIEEIKNSKIELNMTAGKGGQSHLDLWLCSDKEDKISGSTNCSYWGWYGNSRNFHPGQYVFSFVKLKEDKWLFISAAKIIDVPENSRANVSILDKYKPFFGRLIIEYKKGNTYGRYVFNLNKIIDDCTVVEILPVIYDGDEFNGYDNISLPFNKLKNIFNGNIMPTYKQALEKITGIYCLTDTKNGKLYIGSASGEGGVMQRWGNYLDSKHGGNKKLISLYKEKGEEYFEKYFVFTIIEYFGLSYDPEKLLRREDYWKRCLDTRKNGYNDN